jgi:hypothetical protein
MFLVFQGLLGIHPHWTTKSWPVLASGECHNPSGPIHRILDSTDQARAQGSANASATPSSFPRTTASASHRQPNPVGTHDSSSNDSHQPALLASPLRHARKYAPSGQPSRSQAQSSFVTIPHVLPQNLEALIRNPGSGTRPLS